MVVEVDDHPPLLTRALVAEEVDGVHRREHLAAVALGAHEFDAEPCERRARSLLHERLLERLHVEDLGVHAAERWA
jgi:hypothetical protein